MIPRTTRMLEWTEMPWLSDLRREASASDMAHKIILVRRSLNVCLFRYEIRPSCTGIYPIESCQPPGKEMTGSGMSGCLGCLLQCLTDFVGKKFFLHPAEHLLFQFSSDCPPNLTSCIKSVASSESLWESNQNRPLQYSICHWLPFRAWPIYCRALRPAIQPSFYLSGCVPFKLHILSWIQEYWHKSHVLHSGW